MTGQEYINAALRLCGAIQPGESVDGGEADDALATLNRMLRHWDLELGPIFSEHLITHTLTIGTFRYTIGETNWDDDPATYDDIQFSRPQRIISAFIRRSGEDRKLKIITWQEYQEIQNKDPGDQMPTHICYHEASPSSAIYLYPPPDAADSLRMVVQYPFKEMDLSTTANGDVSGDTPDDFNTYTNKTNVDTNSNDYTLPPGYDAAIVPNLALLLAPEYDVPMSKYNIIRDMALDTKAAIVRSNFRVNEVTYDPMLPGVSNSLGYDWRIGE